MRLNIACSQRRSILSKELHNDGNPKFERQVAVLAPQPALHAVHCAYCCVDEAGATNLEIVDSSKLGTANLLANLILHWQHGFSILIHCFLFRRAVFDASHCDETLPSHEDWDLDIRLAARGFTRYFLPDMLVFYRVHVRSLVHKQRVMQREDLVLEKAARLSPAAQRLVDTRRQAAQRDMQATSGGRHVRLPLSPLETTSRKARENLWNEP
jgi:hypothetical protein